MNTSIILAECNKDFALLYIWSYLSILKIFAYWKRLYGICIYLILTTLFAARCILVMRKYNAYTSICYEHTFNSNSNNCIKYIFQKELLFRVVHISAGYKESFPPILANVLTDITSTYGTEGNVCVMLPVGCTSPQKKKSNCPTRGILWTALQAAAWQAGVLCYTRHNSNFHRRPSQ